MRLWSNLTPNSFFSFAITYIKILYSYVNLAGYAYK